MRASLFNASRVAIALGKSKRAVQMALQGTKAAGVVSVRGQQSEGYSIDQLPVRFVDELRSIANSRGYRDTQHLLSDPPHRYVPVDKNGDAIPLGDIAQHHIDRAVRLRSALVLTIELKDQLGESESRRRAITAFRKNYHNASEKTWSRHTKRVIQRAAGEERFADLELYFDEVVTRRPEARSGIAVAMTAAERTVKDALEPAQGVVSINLDRRALIWTSVCEFIADAVESGEKQKRAQRRAFELINGSSVTLARTDAALKKLIKRKFDRWCEKGRTFIALQDRRPTRSGPPRAPKLNDEDRHKLIGHTVKNCGGRLSQGFRELKDAGELSPALMSRFIANPSSKSYVADSVRRAIAPDVKRLASYHHGEREHQLRGAYHTRDWSGVAAGDWFQSDDLTPPIYFYKMEGARFWLTRGQFLPMIDERTGMVLGFKLIQERTYNSLDVRCLITNICSVHGLPRRGFYFERGLWMRSKSLTGNRNVDLDEIADTGCKRLGIRFRHALLPRAKVVERLLGQIQDRMEGLPGYCGRDEKSDRYERLQKWKLDVEAGRADVREHFLSGEEMREKFAAIIQRYNHEPQQGKRLDGLSPVQGWDQLQAMAEPRMRFDDRILYFLASDLRRLKIGRNGLTITIGKQRFNYKGKETGSRVGEIVFAWFNPERPEVLTCTTNIAGDGAFTVERSYDLPAVDAQRIVPGLLAEENRKLNDHNRYARNLYHIVENSLPSSAFRGQVVGSKIAMLGEQIAEQSEKIAIRRRSEDQLDRDLARKSKRAGVNPILVPRSRESIESLDELAAARAEADAKLRAEDI